MRFEVATARLEHAAELAAAMRPEDVAECEAAGYATAREALEAGIANSDESWAIAFGGELGAIVGVDALEGRAGAYIWCLTAEVVERKRLSFWRASLAVVEQCRRRHGPLYALADRRYSRALAWLQRLGFIAAREVPHPASGLPHHVMTIGGL